VVKAVRKTFFASSLAALLALSVPGVSYAATAKPAPVKKAAPAATKVVVKPKAANSKFVAKPKAATSKVVSKPGKSALKKKSTVHTVHHYYYRPRPRIGVAPSPSPKWPPTGFVSASGVYARIPSGDELLGILSASKDLTNGVNQCAPDPNNASSQAVACGAVLAASNNGCSWWEINSTLVGPDPSTPANITQLGNLRTLAAGTAAHSVSTIILVSGVPLANGMKFTNITAKCWMTQTTESVPSDVFTPLPGIAITPAPSTSPTPTPSPSASSN
jgi:hypothetical protein